jgi:hypothetical protein
LLDRLNERVRDGAEALDALSEPWTADTISDVASIKWLVVFDALAKRAAREEAVAALPLRGELHETIPGLPYSAEHLEAAALLAGLTTTGDGGPASMDQITSPQTASTSHAGEPTSEVAADTQQKAQDAKFTNEGNDDVTRRRHDDDVTQRRNDDAKT